MYETVGSDNVEKQHSHHSSSQQGNINKGGEVNYGSSYAYNNPQQGMKPNMNFDEDLLNQGKGYKNQYYNNNNNNMNMNNNQNYYNNNANYYYNNSKFITK